MSEANTIARPYAQAAFDEAQKLGDLKGWSATLLRLAELMSNPEVQSAVGNPRLSKTKIEPIILELCGKQLNKQQINFIRVLVESGRLCVSAEIAAMFEGLRAEAEKFVEVTVVSAFELSDAQQQKISAALRARMEREIKLSCKIDKALLGGVVIRAGDKVIDGSAHTRLAELTNALA
ncbi:MAG: F0F1 ATP synthase subunit delta [Gallionellales bacterium CG_4_10_14_3_um_filter_54_96]|nr:MAG: ATP synthase F1 subunit delta [Gallionellaceae bacterium CG1_02_56_997]PIV15192.1 MAG: F0F1 ATP synthase subunit delta [Gallionellales bacterium CG03_land_8_20_14_0_80_55_15]PIY03641.1 MAG: F0F1 ATP synthase subunit delta [Gallionellales bacterium CG_4_10_14_3_um_filter_54_96]PJC05924.1 MAG: F0F1 ATP synthase subunit delta [Gallionellales bacterium CG_4_9_14_0_8_um_filter_55_61]HCJ51321.1 F0F1 ATP synthase subunit delta [Gallionella sp.]